MPPISGLLTTVDNSYKMIEHCIQLYSACNMSGILNVHIAYLKRG